MTRKLDGFVLLGAIDPPSVQVPARRRAHGRAGARPPRRQDVRAVESPGAALAVPGDGFGVILWDALARGVKLPEGELRLGSASLGEGAQVGEFLC